MAAAAPGPTRREVKDRQKELRGIKQNARSAGARKKRQKGRVVALRRKIRASDSPQDKWAMREKLLGREEERKRLAAKQAKIQTKLRSRRHITKDATPGVATPVIQPFMTADELMDQNEAQQALQETVSDLDFDLENQRAESAYEKTEIDRGRLVGHTTASESMSSRGLFQSSIRDAELYDIDAAAGLRKNFLDRQLDTSVLDAQRQKLAAQSAWDRFQIAMNQKMVENAQKANEGAEPWVEEPTEGYHYRLNRRGRLREVLPRVEQESQGVSTRRQIDRRRERNQQERRANESASIAPPAALGAPAAPLAASVAPSGGKRRKAHKYA